MFDGVIKKYPLLSYAMQAGFYAPHLDTDEALDSFIKYVEAVDNARLS
jgi:hypothetical protein